MSKARFMVGNGRQVCPHYMGVAECGRFVYEKAAVCSAGDGPVEIRMVLQKNVAMAGSGGL